MDQPASSCMRSSHPANPIWGCVRTPHSGVPSGGLQPYQQAGPFSLHQKPDFLAYTDFSSSCLVPSPHAYPRADDRLYPAEAHATATAAAVAAATGYQSGRPAVDWQFGPCEPRGVRGGQEPCQGAGGVGVGGGVVGGTEMDSAGGAAGGDSRLPGGGGLEGDYSPQGLGAAGDADKKMSKKKKDITGE